MATDKALEVFSVTAAADLSSSQYLFVKTDGNLAGDGELGYVLQEKPKSGEVGALAFKGITKCTAGAALTVGTLVASDAAGKAVAATVGEEILGEVVSAASGADEIFSLLVKGAGAQAS